MTAALHQYDATGRPTLRNPQVLMRPERLAAMQPSRLSGTWSVMNRMIAERWDIRLERMDVDAEANGTILYSIRIGDHEFSFIAFSRAPNPEARTGRIIGRSWDMMGTLNEGPATADTIEAARREIPLLYRGRATPNALVWCRSNRSMRVFNGVLDALCDGRQPQVEDLNQVCYLMRNTGLDGNGTFGTRAFPALGPDHPLGGMLQAQILNAYLMRELSCDLVEHLAKLRSDRAVPLDPAIRRYIGVGNGSALGLIFYVQKHPRLLNSWITARETAIAEALALKLDAGDLRISRLADLLRRAIRFRREDRMMYETFASSAEVAADLETLLPRLEELFETGQIDGADRAYPLDTLARDCAERMQPESYECFLSLIMELTPDVADAGARDVSGADELDVDVSATVGALRDLIRRDYGWALEIDMQAEGARDYVWYKSATAEEPRRGLRSEVPEARDLGLDLVRATQKLSADLDSAPAEEGLARFLLRHPEHRFYVARAQSLATARYHTPMANIDAADFTPIDLVRLMNVALHGIDKTRDYLQRNLRGVLFHGAPTRDDLRAGAGADWFFPGEPQQ
ncbi:hypothetical protein CBW24_03480 [Pacificitalea manganoxidans]|uniref:Uncharacterized protein n=1 Tax=Pacificitalea manganoxidans TaxID=1411902 RepID=A0A291LXI6_9RHOB|nr:hypothetical protein [Pacificitalea manganoxidans]ATI41155.1 hypothetical protein CBW24_03480 [Pacificitalea manganoxidans]MDR6308530.1 hypothetical protein [Pacificitalea manganoxidans]